MRIPKGDEQELKRVVGTVGPVAVAINADGLLNWNSSGIYTNSTCGEPNHAVLIVGCGGEGAGDYWLAKNAWGTQWGDKGYFKLARNRGNMCRVADYAVYPLGYNISRSKKIAGNFRQITR